MKQQTQANPVMVRAGTGRWVHTLANELERQLDVLVSRRAAHGESADLNHLGGGAVAPTDVGDNSGCAGTRARATDRRVSNAEVVR